MAKWDGRASKENPVTAGQDQRDGGIIGVCRGQAGEGVAVIDSSTGWHRRL